MNGSETLTVPAQTDTEAAYVYQRADGSVERASSAAEAFNLCPVLREMAQENPEQANILLELAAVGKEKMEKENEEEKEPEIEERLEDKQKETTKIKEPLSPANLEQPGRPEKPKQVDEIAQAEPQGTAKPSEINTTHFVEQAIQQKPLEIAGSKPVRTEQSKQPETSQASQIISKAEETEQAPQLQTVSRGNDKAEIRDVPKPANINQQSELNNALPQPQVAGEAEQVEVKSYTQTEVLDTGKNQTEYYFEVPMLETEALTDIEDGEIDVALNQAEIFSEDYEIVDFEATYQIPNVENEEAATFEAETYTDEQLEALFEPETIETYKELLALIDTDETESLAIEEPDEAQTDVSFALMQTDAEEHYVNEFGAFIAEQSILEEPMTLETIQEEAGEQPLEQTLVQLTELLSSDTEGASQPEQVELYQILREIEAELPSCYYISQETGEPKLRITPELTEKLLALLQHLGYEHPKEVLVDMVRKYGLAFLLQALQYMSQLNSEYERQEFVSASTSISDNDDEGTRLRIGKALFGLIGDLIFEPVSFIPN